MGFLQRRNTQEHQIRGSWVAPRGPGKRRLGLTQKPQTRGCLGDRTYPEAGASRKLGEHSGRRLKSLGNCLTHKRYQYGTLEWARHLGRLHARHDSRCNTQTLTRCSHAVNRRNATRAKEHGTHDKLLHPHKANTDMIMDMHICQHDTTRRRCRVDRGEPSSSVARSSTGQVLTGDLLHPCLHTRSLTGPSYMSWHATRFVPGQRHPNHGEQSRP